MKQIIIVFFLLSIGFDSYSQNSNKSFEIELNSRLDNGKYELITGNNLRGVWDLEQWDYVLGTAIKYNINQFFYGGVDISYKSPSCDKCQLGEFQDYEQVTSNLLLDYIDKKQISSTLLLGVNYSILYAELGLSHIYNFDHHLLGTKYNYQNDKQISITDLKNVSYGTSTSLGFLYSIGVRKKLNDLWSVTVGVVGTFEQPSTPGIKTKYKTGYKAAGLKLGLSYIINNSKNNKNEDNDK